MKHQLFPAIALVAALASCADTDMVRLDMEAPQTVADYSYLKGYSHIKDYNANAGLRISAGELAEGGMAYRIAVYNFARITPTDAFCHQTMVKASGTIGASAIETQGARVDGFALSIADSINAAMPDGLAQAFKTLAATGKLVKISNLAVGMADSASADNATEEQLKAQAQRVADILKAYTDNVPQAQRGGVSWHQAIDSTQPLGLWGSNYSRKHAYATFADGIKE